MVDVTEEEQITRTMQRDGVSRDHVLKILQAQAKREQRLAVADDIIENHDNSLNQDEQIKQLHQHYLELAQKKQYRTIAMSEETSTIILNTRLMRKCVHGLELKTH